MTAPTSRPGPRSALRALAFRIFYTMPPRLRRTLVRLGVGTYTVGAVVLATDPVAGRLLLVRQPPGKGWSLPAGLLRRDEVPVDGAAREFKEETGVSLTAATLRPAVPNAVVHTRGRWIDLVFTVELPGDVALRSDGAEILDVAWHPVNALPPVTPATARLMVHYGLGPYAEYPEAAR